MDHLLVYLARSLLYAVMSLITALGGLVSSSTHPATPTESGVTEVGCSAVKVRSQPAANALARGVAYRGDAFTYTQFTYHRSERAWYTRGEIVRGHDRVTISGYIPYECGTPYGSNALPLPATR
ncbi:MULTISPECIES: hypothetical protein [unclassified Streptomyces]|uniref:hypothetical protein n=1 Tax=unclassified Streptomyces TaxID=2593676 RepID=UPI0004C876A9|nr:MULTISPECIES: hypothetical protein [unclassified Streptomyces]MCI3930173.1 hypothetical protein [Streptomyces sp. AN091965]